MDRGAWQATVHGGCKESDTTERTHTHTHSPCLESQHSLVFSDWLSNRKWSGCCRTSGWGTVVRARHQEPGDDSWIPEKREGTLHFLRFYYLLSFAEKQTCIQIQVLSGSNCVTLFKLHKVLSEPQSHHL